ncbi:LysR family transcriptional regulator [Vibrio sp. WJH972]
MEITTMKYFIVLAETQSLREASKLLYISPSALSRQIKNFEHNFHSPLFERRPTGMFLTEEGKIVERHIRRTIREVDLAKSEIDKLKNLLTGKIRLATIEGVVESWVMPPMKAFTHQHPDIRCKLAISGSREAHYNVVNDHADIGIAMQPIDCSNIDIIKSVNTPLAITGRYDHALSKTPNPTLESIISYPFAVLDGSFHTTQLFHQFLKHNNKTFEPKLEFNQISYIKNHIKTSDYLTILPNYAIENEVNNQELFILENEKLPSCKTIIFVRKDRKLTHAATHFISLLCQSIKTMDSCT